MSSAIPKNKLSMRKFPKAKDNKHWAFPLNF